MQEMFVLSSLLGMLAVALAGLRVLFIDPLELSTVMVRRFLRCKIKISELRRPKFELLLKKLLELREQGYFENISAKKLRSPTHFNNELYIYPYLKLADVWGGQNKAENLDSFWLDFKQMQEVYAIILQAEDPETLPKFED